MLKEILQALDRDQLLSRVRLAQEMKTSEAVIDKAVTELLRMGYVELAETGADCATFCSGCPYAQNCAREIVRTYRIAEKGQRLLASS